MHWFVLVVCGAMGDEFQVVSAVPFALDKALRTVVTKRVTLDGRDFQVTLTLEMVAPSWGDPDDQSRWASAVTGISLQLIPKKNRPNLTAKGLREIRLGELHEDAHWAALNHYGLEFFHLMGHIESVGAIQGGNGPTDRTLMMLAEVYKRGEVLDGKPVAAVMSFFDLPRSTATRWVRKARDAGFLEQSKRSRK